MGKSSSPPTTYKNNNNTIHRTSLSYPVCLLTMLLASHRYHCLDASTPPPLPRCLHAAATASMLPRRCHCLDAFTCPPLLPRCLHVPAIAAIPTSPNMPRQLAFSFLASLSGPRPPSPYPGPTVASETLLPLQNKTKLAIHMQYELWASQAAPQQHIKTTTTPYIGHHCRIQSAS